MSYKFYENHSTPCQLPDIYHMPKNHSEYSENNSDVLIKTPHFRSITLTFRTKLRTPGTQLRASEHNFEPQNTTPSMMVFIAKKTGFGTEVGTLKFVRIWLPSSL